MKKTELEEKMVDITAKVKAKYWEQIKQEDKQFEYRQFDDLVLINADTQEELRIPISFIEALDSGEQSIVVDLTIGEIEWGYDNRSWLKTIYRISLDFDEWKERKKKEAREKRKKKKELSKLKR